MRNEIYIRARLQPVPSTLEVRELLDVIIELAIADDGDRAVFVVDRLIATDEIDDGQTTHAERGSIGVVPTVTVGTAVRQPANRLPDTGSGDRSVDADESGYAAHWIMMPGLSSRRREAGTPIAARSLAHNTHAPPLPGRLRPCALAKPGPAAHATPQPIPLVCPPESRSCRVRRSACWPPRAKPRPVARRPCTESVCSRTSHAPTPHRAAARSQRRSSEAPPPPSIPTTGARRRRRDRGS